MIKDKLKEYRLLCNYSQKQIADALNVHRSTYSYYEIGKTEPSLDNLRILAKIFGVSTDDLLELEQSSPLVVRDRPEDESDPVLPYGTVSRVGELSRDERMLIMRYRLLTESQRRDLLSAMLDPSEAEDIGKK